MATNRSNNFKIIIQDEDLAAWMPLNNTFTWEEGKQWPEKDRLWCGVLIQLGEYRRIPTRKHMDLLGSVILRKKDETLVKGFTKAEFTQKNLVKWINIVAKGPKSPAADPMSPADCSRLLLHPPRTLHHYFKPYSGGITFWEDRGCGYQLTATQTAHSGLHNDYTFEFTAKNDLTVEVYDIDLCTDQITKALYPEAEELVITLSAGGDHGSQMNPPQQP